MAPSRGKTSSAKRTPISRRIPETESEHEEASSPDPLDIIEQNSNYGSDASDGEKLVGKGKSGNQNKNKRHRRGNENGSLGSWA